MWDNCSRPLSSSGQSTADRNGALSLARPDGWSFTVLPLAQPVRNILSVLWEKFMFRWYQSENAIIRRLAQSVAYPGI
eukprot:4627883-Pyramimonas_sp.AAC.1